MSKSSVAHMLLYPSIVLLLAHHQMLSYCSLANPDSHEKQVSDFVRCWLWNFVDKMWWQKLVLDPWSLQFDPCLCIRILACTTFVAAFPKSSKHGPHALWWLVISYLAAEDGSRGPDLGKPIYCDIIRQGSMPATLDLFIQLLQWDKSLEMYSR